MKPTSPDQVLDEIGKELARQKKLRGQMPELSLIEAMLAYLKAQLRSKPWTFSKQKKDE